MMKAGANMYSCYIFLYLPANGTIANNAIYHFDPFQGKHIFLLCICNNNCAITVDVPE